MSSSTTPIGTPSNEFNPNTLPFNDPKVSKKVAIVTGGNSGIGYFTVLHLYMHGWTVYMAARNPTKASDAIAKVKQEATERKQSLPAEAVFGSLEFVKLDLSSLAQVKQATAEFIKKESQLDLLINNAGVMLVPIQMTEDNLDIQIQTNHVSPLFFSLCLIPLLEKSKNPRIVMVSSDAYSASTDPEDISELYRCWPTFISGWRRYGNSKTAIIQATKVLAKRYPNILSVSLHPGVSLESGLMDHWKNMPVVGYLIKGLGVLAKRMSLEECCYNTLFTGLSPDVNIETSNGEYFMPVGYDTELLDFCTDKKKIDRTWAWTTTQLVSRGFLKSEEASKFHSLL